MIRPDGAALEDFLELAEHRITGAAALPVRHLSAPERISLVERFASLLDEMDRHLADYGPAGRYAAAATPRDAAAAARGRQALQDARDALRHSIAGAVRRRLEVPDPADGSRDGAVTLIEDARRMLSVGRDLMGGHHAVGGRPDTPYGTLLAGPAGQRFVMDRIGILAEQTRRTGDALALIARPGNGPSRRSFDEALLHLVRAGVALRVPGDSEAATMGRLPAAVPPAPDRPQVEEDQAARLHHLLTGADRLQTAAHHAVRRPGFTTPYHAAALRGTARPLALSHLLAGHLLRATVAAFDGELPPEPVRATGELLRAAALAWQQVLPAWERLADLGDPPGRRPTPHPSMVEAESMAVRLGRVLYADDWLPQHRPGAPRPAADLVAEGLDPLLRVLHRIPAAAAVHAEYAPAIVERMAGRLVTDDGMVDPRRHGGRRWFPAQPVQFIGLGEAYTRAQVASAQAAQSVADLAEAVGLPVPRAALDRAAQLARHAPAVEGTGQDPSRASGWRAAARDQAAAVRHASWRTAVAAAAPPAASWRSPAPRAVPSRREEAPRRDESDLTLGR